MSDTKEGLLSAEELRKQFERILSDHEQSVRADIANHINGDKSRDPYITCADSRMQLEHLIQSQKKLYADMVISHDQHCEKNHEEYKDWCSYCEYERTRAELRAEQRARNK